MKTDIRLADQLLAKPSWATYAPSVSSLRTAKRFTFDTSASAFLGHMLKKVGRLILREQEFARPPYPVTWVEMDAIAYAVAHDGQLFQPDNADLKFGFLFIDNVVYPAAASRNMKAGSDWSPFRLKLHQPISFEQELETAQNLGLSRLTYRVALLGGVERMDDKWWSGPEATAIARSHTYETLVPAWPAKLQRELLTSHAGVLKQVLAVLLMMTKPGQRVLTIREEGHSRGWYKGKQLVMGAHNTVTLHCKLPVAIRRFITGIHTGLHRRHHDVRGHWAQTRRLQNNCSHIWDAIDPDHYRCLRCEAKRWWRKDHQRGRPELGEITKDYDVTE